MAKTTLDTRQLVLRAALRRFAEKGYAGTSVQEIVGAARVTKPALYYYFRNKADLYRALVEWACEERYRIMQEAAAQGGGVAGQLTGICAALFEFTQKNRELMRLAFSTAFAARGEVPVEAQCHTRSRRNFDFIHGLIQQAAARGELSRQFDTEELAMGFLGIMNIHVMAYLVKITTSLTHDHAQRIVQLFLAGARPS